MSKGQIKIKLGWIITIFSGMRLATNIVIFSALIVLSGRGIALGQLTSPTHEPSQLLCSGLVCHLHKFSDFMLWLSCSLALIEID